MRPLVLASILVIAESSAAGQTTPGNASIAWIAYRAAEAGDRSQVASLQALLPPLLERKSDDGRYALGAVLDALWRLDARPALGLIPRIYETHPVEAIMFLTRFGAERDGVALPLLRGARGSGWLALANLMLRDKPHGLGEVVVRDLRVVLHITVSDDGEASTSFGAGGTYCSVLRRTPGFPPLAAYKLVADRDTEADILASGPRPIRYRRAAGTEGEAPADVGMGEAVTAVDRLAYLDTLLGGRPVGLSGTEKRAVAWTTEARLRADVARLKRSVERRYDALLDTLTAAGVLDDNERRSLKPQVSVEIEDVRHDTSEPLPSIR